MNEKEIAEYFAEIQKNDFDYISFEISYIIIELIEQIKLIEKIKEKYDISRDTGFLEKTLSLYVSFSSNIQIKSYMKAVEILTQNEKMFQIEYLKKCFKPFKILKYEEQKKRSQNVLSVFKKISEILEILKYHFKTNHWIF